MRRAKKNFFHFYFIRKQLIVLFLSFQLKMIIIQMKMRLGLFIFRVLYVKSTMSCAITITIAQSELVCWLRALSNWETEDKTTREKKKHQHQQQSTWKKKHNTRSGNSIPNGMRKFELRPTSIQTKTSLSSRWGHFSTHFPKNWMWMKPIKQKNQPFKTRKKKKNPNKNNSFFVSFFFCRHFRLFCFIRRNCCALNVQR